MTSIPLTLLDDEIERWTGFVAELPDA